LLSLKTPCWLIPGYHLLKLPQYKETEEYERVVGQQNDMAIFNPILHMWFRGYFTCKGSSTCTHTVFPLISKQVMPI
jgi:hypothetical protein